MKQTTPNSIVRTILFGLIFMYLLSSCSQTLTESLTIDDAAQQVEQLNGFNSSSMHTASVKDMQSLLGISSDELTDFVLKQTIIGTNQDEYGIFIAVEGSSKAVLEKVNTYLELRREQWNDNYLAEEGFKIQKAECAVSGTCIYYAIGNGEFSDMESIFKTHNVLARGADILSAEQQNETLTPVQPQKEVVIPSDFSESMSDSSVVLIPTAAPTVIPESSDIDDTLSLTSPSSTPLITSEPISSAEPSVSSSPSDIASTLKYSQNIGAGIDFADLVGKSFYMGTYKHVLSMNSFFASKTASSWTEPAESYEDSATPVQWYVLGREGNENSYAIITKYIIDSRSFHTEPAWLSFDYTKCAIRTWLNGKFADNFSAAELGALDGSDIVQKMWNPNSGDWAEGNFTTLWGSGSEHTTSWPKTTTNNKFYLSWREYNSDVFHWDAANATVNEYVLSGDIANVLLKNGKSKTNSGDDIWVLSRSPMPESANHILPGNYTTSKFGIRPVTKINPNNVLMYTASDGDAVTLTLLSDDVTLDSVRINEIELAGEEKINHSTPLVLFCSGTNADGFAYKIIDESGDMVASGTSNSGGFTIKNIPTSGQSKLYIWAEKTNTDGCKEGSRPICIALL